MPRGLVVILLPARALISSVDTVPTANGAADEGSPKPKLLLGTSPPMLNSLKLLVLQKNSSRPVDFHLLI